MKGYKATDKDMKCRDFQFELGKWYTHDGDLVTCQSGFHFCEQPSGPWAYYSEPTTRIFEIEADDVLDVPFEAGADFKRVAKRIRLVKEITPPKENGSNTGNRNTGNRNTGYGNCANNSAGFFCNKEPKVVSFDKPTKYTFGQFCVKFPEYYQLCEALHKPDAIDFELYKKIPNITKAKLEALHKAHLKAKVAFGVQEKLADVITFVEFEYPRSWWEMFKKQYAPQWFKQKFL